MMKNIHVIQRDQPSRLHYYYELNKRYALSKEPLSWRTASHLYVTSDEEIKEGDAVIHYFGIGYEVEYPCEPDNLHSNTRKKIILTTDTTLIENGVQPIDDEFLEWFVKNPTCEFVKVKHKDIIQYGNMTMKDFNGDGSYYYCTNCGDLEVSRSKQEILKFGVEYYKIIIPQEEFKHYPIKNLDKLMLHERISLGLDRELQRQKDNGKKFISDEEIDAIIDQVIKEELEEPKQYSIGGFAPGNYTGNCITCEKQFQGSKKAFQCEPCAVGMVNTKVNINDEGGVEIVKQETLEEYIEKNTKGIIEPGVRALAQMYLTYGAKWQAERMYSEEEVLELLNDCRGENPIDIEKWFEQFKKK